MTKEIVELPDRKSGDINEIRDKKIALAKNATAQSDLPQQLEYLIKNGQTGEFMNVLDSYINEKIRSALGSLIASLDKGAAGTTKAIACIDTNNDLGIINPANLASVLGIKRYTFDSPGNYTTDINVNGGDAGRTILVMLFHGYSDREMLSFYFTYGEQNKIVSLHAWAKGSNYKTSVNLT